MGAAWNAAVRGWLTPAVLFVAVNLVIATIAVASRLVSAAPGGDDDDEAAGERRGFLLRSPSLAVGRLRSSFSFSRLGLGLADDGHAQVVVVQPRPLSGDDDWAPDPGPSLQQPAEEANQLEAERQREEARVERSRSEAAALAEAPDIRRRPRARRAVAEELRDGGHGSEEVVEVDARADDFIRRFREQLRLQRLDSILRYRDRGDSLRRTGTA